MDYRTRQAAAGLRQIINRRVQQPTMSGSPAARDNAGMAAGRGQVTAYYDVLDADGNEIFLLGTTGMTDGAVIE